MGFWFIRICFTVIGRLGITERNACKEVSCFLVDVLFGNISENFQMSTYIIWVVRILWRDAPTVVLMLLLLLLWWLVLTYLLSLVRTVAVVLYVEIVMDLDPLVFFINCFHAYVSYSLHCLEVLYQFLLFALSLIHSEQFL